MTSEQQIPRRSGLAIIGAGPIGLEAAAWAALHGWDFAVFERGDVAEHLKRWAHVRLFSPFGMNHSTWGLELIRSWLPGYQPPEAGDLLAADEHRRRYLLPLAQSPPLAARVYRGVEVLEVGKAGLSKGQSIGKAVRWEHPFRLLLERQGRETVHLAEAVIDASGVYSTPQFLGDGNIPAPGERRAREEAPDLIHSELRDILGRARSDFAGKKTVVAGSGHSAATHLEALARLAQAEPSTRVVWICRSRRTPPYPLYEDDPLPYRDQLSRFANRLAEDPPPWLRYLPGARVERIELEGEGGQRRVRLEISTGGVSEALRADQLLASVGFRPDNRLYRQLQVHECYATAGPIQLAGALLGASADCLAQPAQGVELLRNPEPGFFILGNKSYGTNSAFLLTTGIQQVDAVMRALQERFSREAAPRHAN